MALSLTNADIVARMSVLADYVGKAESGSTTTLVNSKIFDDFADDDFNNQYICILSGDDKGSDRIITDFVTSTGTFTFDALDSAVSNITQFAIVEDGYIGKMEEAILYIQEKIKNDGKDIDLFLTESQLKEIHLYKTLDIICQDKFQDATDEDLYYARHQHYNNLFESTYGGLKADYDANEDGVISSDEELQGGSFGILVR